MCYFCEPILKFNRSAYILRSRQYNCTCTFYTSDVSGKICDRSMERRVCRIRQCDIEFHAPFTNINLHMSMAVYYTSQHFSSFWCTYSSHRPACKSSFYCACMYVNRYRACILYLPLCIIFVVVFGACWWKKIQLQNIHALIEIQKAVSDTHTDIQRGLRGTSIVEILESLINVRLG